MTYFVLQLLQVLIIRELFGSSFCTMVTTKKDPTVNILLIWYILVQYLHP